MHLFCSLGLTDAYIDNMGGHLLFHGSLLDGCGPDTTLQGFYEDKTDARKIMQTPLGWGTNEANNFLLYFCFIYLTIFFIYACP